MRHLFLLPLGVTLAACQPSNGAVTATDAWVRLPAVPQNPGAAYFTLTGGGEDEVLTGVASPIAERTELHESMSAGGMMSMRALPNVRVPAREAIAFEPGGRHVMLFDVSPAIRPGAQTTLTLRFESGRSVDVPARVLGAGDAPPR
ncbi:copper chaperone PCu(A)C [Sphingomonas sp.]